MIHIFFKGWVLEDIAISNCIFVSILLHYKVFSTYLSFTGSKPLSQLAKKAPNFNKKEEIFITLTEYQVSMPRAAWFIKLSSAYTVAVSEAKIKKRQLPDPTTGKFECEGESYYYCKCESVCVPFSCQIRILFVNPLAMNNTVDTKKITVQFNSLTILCLHNLSGIEKCNNCLILTNRLHFFIFLW